MKKNCIQRVQAFLLALVLICSLAVPVAMAEGEISLNHTAAAMEIGDTLTLTADVADMLASAGISWKSNNGGCGGSRKRGRLHGHSGSAWRRHHHCKYYYRWRGHPSGHLCHYGNRTRGSCEPRGNLNGCHAKHRGKKRHTAAGSCGLSN